jgi:hypothetical protein
VEDGGLHLPEGRDWSIGSTCQLLYGTSLQRGATLSAPECLPAAAPLQLLAVEGALVTRADCRGFLYVTQAAMLVVSLERAEAEPREGERVKLVTDFTISELRDSTGATLQRVNAREVTLPMPAPVTVYLVPE